MQVIGTIYFILLIVFMIISIKADYLYFGGNLFFVTSYLWNLSDGYVFPKLCIFIIMPMEVMSAFFLSPVVWVTNKFQLTPFLYDVAHVIYIALVATLFYINHKKNASIISNIQNQNIVKYFTTGVYEGNPDDQIKLCEYILEKFDYPLNNELSNTISELSICYNHNAAIAFMALAGRALEITLKQSILIKKLEYKEHWMLGELYKFCIDEGLLEKETPIEQSVKTITSYRKQAVHISSNAGLITKNQIEIVLYSVMHVVWSISVKNSQNIVQEVTNVENT